MNRAYAFCVCLALALGCLGFLSNPILQAPGVDSSIFLYVARLINEGGVPYRDVFDQKGPLIFLIDALALRLGGMSFFGLWLTDCAAFLSACLLAHKLVRPHVVPKAAWLLAVPFCMLYQLFSCGGNMPEMWIVSFSLLALLAVRRDTALAWASAGACVGCILLLKLNMAVVLLPLLLQTKGRMRPVLALGAGIVLALLPVIGWLAVRGALPAFWEVYIVYNRQYAAASLSLPSLHRGTVTVGAFLLLTLFQLRAYRADPVASALRPNAAYFAAAAIAIMASGNSVRYYGPILPACVLPLALLIDRGLSRRPVVLRGALALAFLAAAGLVALRNRSGWLPSRRAALQELAGRIDERDSLTVLGCDCLAYLRLDARAPVRFPYQGTIGHVSEEYRAEMVNGFRLRTSKFLLEPDGVLSTPGALGVSWAKAAVEAHYRPVAASGPYVLWERKNAEPKQLL